jgi:hypothetical protein
MAKNIRVNLYLDDEYHSVVQDEVGKQHISEFFRLIEEEFFNCPEYADLNIRLRAREISSRARAKLMAQKKLVHEKESIKEREAREASERALIIEQTVIDEIHRLSFRKIDLPEHDDQWATSESARKTLVDEISHRCQMDLRWQDIDQFVRKAVQA